MSTHIEWTDETWNPVTGCDRTSPGCDNCYALTMAKRLKAMGQPHYQRDGDPRTSGPGFGVTCHPDMLERPLHWKRPRRVFVNSMSDLFHPDVPFEFIEQVWNVMDCAPQHTFQVLTKRPQRMREVVAKIYADWNAGAAAQGHPPYESLPNVWVGTSIESDRYAWRADHLRATPAAVRWISAEPLLGPLPSLDLTGIDWLVVGGESGRGARPMHPNWVRDLRDRCTSKAWIGAPAFFFKQWGEWQDGSAPDRASTVVTIDGQAYTAAEWHARPLDGVHRHPALMARVGKKHSGRLLDGREWDEYPTT